MPPALDRTSQLHSAFLAQQAVERMPDWSYAPHTVQTLLQSHGRGAVRKKIVRAESGSGLHPRLLKTFWNSSKAAQAAGTCSPYRQKAGRIAPGHSLSFAHPARTIGCCATVSASALRAIALPGANRRLKAISPRRRSKLVGRLRPSRVGNRPLSLGADAHVDPDNLNACGRSGSTSLSFISLVHSVRDRSLATRHCGVQRSRLSHDARSAESSDSQVQRKAPCSAN